MAGDAIFSLRSALDCCWMGLKRAVHAEAAKHTLPRKDTRDDLVKFLVKVSMEHSFKGADRFLLDTLRTYRDGNEALWFAAQVDNWNKHNMLVTTVQRTTVASFSGTFPGGGRLESEGNQIEGNVQLFNFSGPAANFQPDADADIFFEVMLVSRKPVDKRPLLPFLSKVVKDTQEAVEAFAREFGKDSA
jgi:hypothetical protein